MSATSQREAEPSRGCAGTMQGAGEFARLGRPTQVVGEQWEDVPGVGRVHLWADWEERLGLELDWDKTSLVRVALSEWQLHDTE